MKLKNIGIIAMIPLLCVLLFAGCAGTVEETAPSGQPSGTAAPEETDRRTVTLSAYFRQADGTPIGQRSIRLSDGENRMDYPLDDNGQVQISGLSGTGAYTVSVMEGDQELGAMTLSLSAGAVIDAATDAEGVGHITLKEDTDLVSLDFTLDEDGTLTCALRLSKEGQGGT